VAIPTRRDQAPGWTCGHFSYEHCRADHEQNARRTGNHVQGDLLGAQHVMGGGCSGVVCHRNLAGNQVIGVIRKAQIDCSALAAAE
jgi:hypothetical protein